MSLSLSKTELAFIQGSREFTKEQARVLRYRINKKLKNQAKTDTDNQNQKLEHSSAVFGIFALGTPKAEEEITAGRGIEALRARPYSLSISQRAPFDQHNKEVLQD